MGRADRIARLKIGIWSAGMIGGLALTCALGAQTPAKPPGRARSVHINGADYGPLPTGLKTGDSITFVNDDTVAHTVTARDHSFDLHLNPGQRATLTMQKDGTFPIYCIYHSTMRGVLVAAPR
jgi:plastocyanin